MLLDTWAWIEWFKQGGRAQMIKQKIKGQPVYISILSFAEIANWCQCNGVDDRPYGESIRQNATTLGLTEQTAQMAGRALAALRKKSPGMGLLDAIIYAQATEFGLTVLTGDAHFEQLENVEFIR